MQLVGVLLVAQGFGSVITRFFWNHSFGVTGLIDHVVHLPWWAGTPFGVAGVVVVAWGYQISHAGDKGTEA